MLPTRRKSVRLKVSIPVDWCEVGKLTHCRSTLEEVAEGGVFVRTLMPLAPGATIELELHTKHGPVAASGIVAWARAGHGMGVAIPDPLGVGTAANPF